MLTVPLASCWKAPLPPPPPLATTVTTIESLAVAPPESVTEAVIVCVPALRAVVLKPAPEPIDSIAARTPAQRSRKVAVLGVRCRATKTHGRTLAITGTGCRGGDGRHRRHIAGTPAATGARRLRCPGAGRRGVGTGPDKQLVDLGLGLAAGDTQRMLAGAAHVERVRSFPLPAVVGRHVTTSLNQLPSLPRCTELVLALSA